MRLYTRPFVVSRMGRGQWFFHSMRLNIRKQAGERIAHWCGRCGRSR